MWRRVSVVDSSPPLDEPSMVTSTHDIPPPNSHVSGEVGGRVAGDDLAACVALDLEAATEPQVALDGARTSGGCARGR